MTFTIPDQIAQDAGLDEKSAALEFALALYGQQRISGSQVRAMCGLGYFEFEKEVVARGLPTGFLSDEDGEVELETIRKHRAK